ncbi:MAG: gliding motility lipoprotein GldD [Bacteroidota bacterium]
MKHCKRIFIQGFLIAFILMQIFSCSESTPIPRPRGYFRIVLPERSYKKFDSVSYPYTFEYPGYAAIERYKHKNSKPFWVNIKFPQFKGTMHISYQPVKNDLETFIDDARTFANKHIAKATAINDSVIIDPDRKMYGMIYDIFGSDAASPYQFYLTDSTKNFVRGALYFEVLPNNDSLAPVIDFIREDIRHLIHTFRWKEKGK